MSLSLDDFEDVKQEEKQSSAAEAAAQTASAPASTINSGIGLKPPTSESSATGLNVPGLINQGWEAVKPAFNPVHYGTGGPQDYTNIDVPTTIAHGLGLAGIGAGVAGRIKRGLSGESAANAQYAEQNKLSRERFEYQKQRDALADEQNLRQAESKVIAKAAGNPTPEARIEPTFAPEPIPASAPAHVSAVEPVVPKATPTPQFPQATVQQPSIGSYGQTTLNAPVGAPNPLPSAPPPAEIAPAPVAPKPLSELEQVRLEKAKFDLEAAKAKEARAQEAHASRLAADVKRAEAAAQKKTASGAISPEDQKMLQNSERAKIEKALTAAGVQKAPKAAPVAPPVVAPVEAAAPAAATTTAPAAPAAQGAVPPKGAKWPGGAEGSAVQLFGGTKKNFTPESQAAVEMFKDYVGGALSMPPTGGAIHQIPEASKFYEKYTGEPLPRNPEGKLTRIPEEQMQKLHTGIRFELEDAVKGNKLGTLGKGAMAAAALLGLTGAVQAAQKGDFGPLRQAGFDIGGPVVLGKLGIAALSRAAGTGFSAATYSGNLNEGEERELARRRHEYQQKESQKLGSPLRSVPPPR